MKSIVCKFCQVFGREDGGDDNGGSVRKTKRTTNVKYYSAFRPKYYKIHFTKQHPLKWSEYQKLSDNSKAIAIFQTDVPFVNTLNIHLEKDKLLPFAFDKNIVKKIIGHMIFDAEDEDEQLPKEHTLSLFKRNKESNFYQI